MEYKKDSSRLRFATPSTKLLVLGALSLTVGMVLLLACWGLVATARNVPVLATLVKAVGYAAVILLAVSIALFCAAVGYHVLMPDCDKICCKVRRGLFYSGCGNPLGLQDGELLPRVKCTRKAPGVFELTIFVRGCTVERVVNAAPSISTALNGKYTRYAVTQTDAGVAFDRVTFQIEDVMADKSLTFHSVEEMRPSAATELRVQYGTSIDLTTSGSILVAGKTRSGKTTGIISLLLQVLLVGRDKYGSEVMIIDPKGAELAQLPHVVTPDENGGATGILEAIKRFEATRKARQKVLSDMSKDSGDTVKWWDAGMRPAILFIDEYVSLRTMFPAKAAKDSDYCLATFDDFIRVIATMGQSAGCFVIISIAEASVESGGLPSMLRSAMTTKVLFRPTLPEARLLWDSEKLKDFAISRVYKPGDAWFSSPDGEHDNVSFVHFPLMKFKVYRELGRLLNNYYQDKKDAPPPAEA